MYLFLFQKQILFLYGIRNAHAQHSVSQDNDWLTLNQFIKYKKTGNIVTVVGEADGSFGFGGNDKYGIVGTLPYEYCPSIDIPVVFHAMGGASYNQSGYIDKTGEIRLYDRNNYVSYWGFCVSYPIQHSVSQCHPIYSVIFLAKGKTPTEVGLSGKWTKTDWSICTQSRLVFDIVSGNTGTNGTNVQIYGYNGSAAQKFWFYTDEFGDVNMWVKTSQYSVSPKYTSKTVGVPGWVGEVTTTLLSSNTLGIYAYIYTGSLGGAPWQNAVQPSVNPAGSDVWYINLGKACVSVGDNMRKFNNVCNLQAYDTGYYATYGGALNPTFWIGADDMYAQVGPQAVWTSGPAVLRISAVLRIQTYLRLKQEMCLV